MGFDRPPMLPLPRLLVVDLDFGKRLLEFLEDGDREQCGALGCFYFIPVLPAVFIELNIIEDDKAVALGDLVKIPEPGKIMELVRSEDHPTT